MANQNNEQSGSDVDLNVRSSNKKKQKPNNQTFLIIIGIVLILFAATNLLFDLGVISKNELNDFRVRIFSTVTPRVDVQYRPISNMPSVEVPSAVPTIIPTVLSEPTPLIISTEEGGFLPLKVEQETLDETASGVKNDLPVVVPFRMIIPAINLDAPIVNAEQDEVDSDGVTYAQWQAPNVFAGGWHRDSAGLGQLGNTVINGHHNINGKVFKDLEKLVMGDRISLYDDNDQRYAYQVTNVMILAERDVSLEERLDNARWILPSEDERLTLITCWPAHSNTHRLIIVAVPLITDSFKPYESKP